MAIHIRRRELIVALGGAVALPLAARAASNSVCCRMNRWRVRWSIRQLCCSVIFVGTNRMFALVTASQIASASVESFFCRLTYGFT